MLLARDRIRQDRSFDLLTEAILERDQPRTADLFFQMVARNGRSLSDALNDVACSNKLFTPVFEHECAGFDGTGRTPQALLQELDAI